MAAVREARNMVFVLGTLTTILFLIHQSWKCFKSSFRQSMRFKINGSELDSVASSANRSSMQVCIDNGKSFIYTRKKKAQELSLEELMLIFVVGLIAYPKHLLAGNDLSNMTEIITVCCC